MSRFEPMSCYDCWAWLSTYTNLTTTQDSDVSVGGSCLLTDVGCYNILGLWKAVKLLGSFYQCKVFKGRIYYTNKSG